MDYGSLSYSYEVRLLLVLLNGVILLPTPVVRIGKPEALMAFGLVTQDNWPLFVPFSGSSRSPPGAPCGKALGPCLIMDWTLIFPHLGGVDNVHQNYAFTSWAMG